MAEAKGLMKPAKLKNKLAEFLGATELPRTEITKKLWDYIKANKLQTRTENGKPEQQASSLWLMRVCSRSSKTQNPKANQARSLTLQI